MGRCPVIHDRQGVAITQQQSWADFGVEETALELRWVTEPGWLTLELERPTLCVMAAEIGGRDQPNIFSQFSIGRNDLFPRAVVEHPEIKPGNRMAGLFKEINQMSPDIPAMAHDEDFHDFFLRKTTNRSCHKNVKALFDAPGSLTCIPQFVQVLSITLSIHSIPESAVFPDS